jgi:hypothetical protein
MEPEGWSPCSQELATSSYPEANESTQSTSPNPISQRSILMLSFRLRLGLPNQNVVCTSHLPHARHMPRPSHPHVQLKIIMLDVEAD